MKLCNSCDQERPVNQFGKCSKNPDGLNTVCNPCKRARERELSQLRKQNGVELIPHFDVIEVWRILGL